MPKVLNKRISGIPDGAIYVGRPSKWGNPFVLEQESEREVVVVSYRIWIMNQSKLLLCLNELRGKDLVCWCAPKPCHADVLLELANG